MGSRPDLRPRIQPLLHSSTATTQVWATIPPTSISARVCWSLLLPCPRQSIPNIATTCPITSPFLFTFSFGPPFRVKSTGLTIPTKPSVLISHVVCLTSSPNSSHGASMLFLKHTRLTLTWGLCMGHFWCRKCSSWLTPSAFQWVHPDHPILNCKPPFPHPRPNSLKLPLFCLSATYFKLYILIIYQLFIVCLPFSTPTPYFTRIQDSQSRDLYLLLLCSPST